MALGTPKSVIFVHPGTSVHLESNAFMYVLSISGTVILNYIVFGCSGSGAFKPDSGLTSCIWNLTSYIEKSLHSDLAENQSLRYARLQIKIRHSNSIWIRHSISSNRNQHRNSITPSYIMLANRIPGSKSISDSRNCHSNRISHSKSIWTRHSISSNRNQHRNSITPAHIMLSNRNQPPISI